MGERDSEPSADSEGADSRTRTGARARGGDRARPDQRSRSDDRLGDLLPDVTRDESASGWGDDGDPDERLTREVPPHHT
jgi:hypothetical protein